MPLPDALLDAYARAEQSVFSGLLPTISRAWVAIDERLFLWNYEDQRDFCVYDGCGTSFRFILFFLAFFQEHCVMLCVHSRACARLRFRAVLGLL